MSIVKYFILLWIIVVGINGNEEECPNKCVCKRSPQRDGPGFIKLRCGGAGEMEKIQTLDEIDLLNIASEIIHFNLSGNALTTFFPKVQMIALQKLDLSRNQLSELQNSQFAELPNLRRLDISENSIKTIELFAFGKLESLERLRLNQNQINSIALGTFDPLINLKQLDISGNPLTCDCGLLWLLDWTQKTSLKLVSNPKCNSPPTFKGLSLRKLRVGMDIHCRSPASNSGLPLIDMKPNVNQVVFEGDSLRLHCRAPSISDAYGSGSKFEWTWLDSDPKSYFSDVTIESHFLQSTGFIDSTLRISQLKRNHTGIWSCILASMQGNHSKGITIIVISNDTRYCPITSSSGNKGTYTWPRTIVNYTAAVPCESVNLNYEVSGQKAFYFCSDDGQWENLNTTMCSYISETTKIFEQFSKVNSSIMESAKHFRNYTSNLQHFRDVMDIVFAVDTMENYLKYLSINQIGGVLMDVINSILELPKEYLRKASYLYQSSIKLVNVTEQLAGISSTPLLHKSNIAIEIFTVKKVGFSGLKCTWYTDIENPLDRLFHCATNSQTDTAELKGKLIESSITIPETLFYQIRKDPDYNFTNKFHNILVSMYANNKLFPVSEEDSGKIDVTSAVVGTKLIDKAVYNLTDPVVIMLRIPSESGYDDSVFYTPVWWNAHLNNGSGNWSPEGCHFSHQYQEHIVFFCHHFGHYGLLQDIDILEAVTLGAKFKFSHPAIYVGSFILFTSLLVVVLTYLFSYNSIQMPKKAKHSLINTWLAICFLCFMYVFGIYQTEDVRVCQIVGMLIHYFTLSSLLWMCVSVNCMYSRLNKNDIMELQDDELTSEQPIKKPIIGLYFVGWGVAIIVCGISAAINIREYASPTYCFLRIGPPLSAIYIPFSILLMFFIIFTLLIRCSIYNLDANGHLSEGTQATENVDLDLLEPSFPNADARSVQSVSSKTASSEVEDPEHAPSAQLKAHVIFLVLYVLTWSSCALATAEPYHFLTYEEDLFSIAFATLATVLSAFTIFFYCVARSDVRSQWIFLTNWMRRKKFGIRTRNVSDTAQNIPQIQIQPLPLPPVSNSLVGDLHITSRSSSRSSHTKSNSHVSNILKGAADLNGSSISEAQGTKINNVNLIVLHRQQYRSNVIPNIIENPTSAAEVFYNPHQSIVARKFFKRQKRHMMKRNNLAPRQRDLNSDTASVMSELKQMRDNSSIDQDIFGTNSKVNNTNIHVEHINKKSLKNPNLFSDSADDSLIDVPMPKIVLNAERLRKRDTSKHKTRKKYVKSEVIEETNMRSVSQQCTLEYSSENVSDSILDKTSPDKSQDLIEALDLTMPLNPIESTEEECASGFDTLFNQQTELPSNLSELASSSIIGVGSNNEMVPTIYINPSHDLCVLKRAQSRASSSVSVSDLDELYQQIRRGPKSTISHSRTFTNSYPLTRNSPCYSESDINSCMIEGFKKDCTDGNNSDNVETTV